MNFKEDWATIQGPHGSAIRVPEILSKLEAGTQVGVSDIEDLYCDLWHQDNVYPSSLAALPYLFKLIKNKDCRFRDELVYLISLIGTGKSASSYQQRKLLRQTEAESTNGYTDMLELAIRDAIVPHLPIFYPYQNHSDFQVATSVRELIEVITVK